MYHAVMAKSVSIQTNIFTKLEEICSYSKLRLICQTVIFCLPGYVIDFAKQ